MVPTSYYSKSPFYRKHINIRSIFLNLKNSSPDSDLVILALRAVVVSNFLYGNFTMSSFELEKVFTRAVTLNQTAAATDKVVDVHLRLQKKQNMVLILRSISTSEFCGAVGKMVEKCRNTAK